MKENTSRYLMGLIFIIGGLLYLGNNLSIWSFNLFFDGWWTLFIIVPSLFNLFKYGFKMSNAIFLAIGIVLLLSAQGYFSRDIIRIGFFPTILVFVGLNLIFEKKTIK